MTGSNEHELAEAARWHTQTILGGNDVPLEQRGDCVRACITSLLGLPLDAVENVQGNDWWQRWQKFVGEYGFSLSIVHPQAEPPTSLWIAVVPSLVLAANHSVIARGYDLVHDPAMKRGYTDAEFAALWENDKMREGWVLVPLDPAALLARVEKAEQERADQVVLAVRQARRAAALEDALRKADKQASKSHDAMWAMDFDKTGASTREREEWKRLRQVASDAIWKLHDVARSALDAEATGE